MHGLRPLLTFHRGRQLKSKLVTGLCISHGCRPNHIAGISTAGLFLPNGGSIPKTRPLIPLDLVKLAKGTKPKLLPGQKADHSSRGSFPAILTVDLELGKSINQYFLFYHGAKNETKAQRLFLDRQVRYEGKDLGHAKASVLVSKLEQDVEYWLCPYFNRDTLSLRFWVKHLQEDFPGLEYSVPQLNSRDTLRPILCLAKEEGFLDKIPPPYLPTLDKDMNLHSGFSVHGNPQTSRKRVDANIRLDKDTQVRMQFTSKGDFETIQFFPYIHPSTGRMKIWDVQSNADVLGGLRHEGFSGAEVKERWRPLFQFAQREGHWRGL